MKLRVLASVLVIIGLLSVSGAAEKVLRWNLGTEPPTLDPALANDTTSLLVIGQIFLGLTDYNPATGEIIGELATHWEVSDDGLIWTFHLRQDAVWTDGTPVTAYDVEYSMKRMLDPATAAKPANLLWVVKGAYAFNTGKGSADEVGIRAIDEYTVQFELDHPIVFFPALATRVVVPVPKQAVEKYGDKWTEPEHIVCNGPYMLKEWVHDHYLVLVKNPTFYDAASVKIDKIYCYMIVEESTALAMYEAGELDVCRTIPPAELDRIKADPVLSKELHTTPRLGTYYFGFNCEKPPFDNPLVRKAFASAIDREALVNYLLKGGQKPALTFISPGVPGHIDGYVEGIGHPYDPEKARQYLAEAGYPNGEGFPEVTLMFNTSELHREIAQFAQQCWKNVLNVKVNLANQEWKVYLETLAYNAPQIFRLGWMASYPDGYDYLKRNFDSRVPENYSRYRNPEFDHAVDMLERERDPEKRMEWFRIAEKLICEIDTALIPLYYYTMNELTKPYVIRDYYPTINDVPYFQNWDILEH